MENDVINIIVTRSVNPTIALLAFSIFSKRKNVKKKKGGRGGGGGQNWAIHRGMP